MRSSETFGVTLTCQMRHQALWKLRTTFGTTSKLAKHLSISNTLCGNLVNLKYVPGRALRKKLERKLGELGVLVEDLWPPELIQTGIIGSKHLKRELDRQVPFEEMASLTDHEVLQIADDQQDPERVLRQEDARDFTDVLLNRLTPRKAEILRRRFGMADGEEHTQGEVAEHFGVTKTRIAQLEKEALRKLRRIRDARRVYRHAID